jgi:hypothetical protein
VLLVDDDEADVGQRREHRRARPHAHPGLAATQPRPLVVAFTPAQRRMEHGHHVAEAGLEAAQRLRGEGDLGDQDDGRAPGIKRRLHRLQVDLGLARAGDSVQQVAIAGSVRPPQSREQRRERRPLVLGQRRRAGGR